ncbi:ras association domain-containing protein 1 isoform X1 [Pleurodeles waltl]|uniref:ras association domain-containing protein 1 isoform X1 n=1 Tax=Pleurodeles waltl TaxID=8319 RepID=UPI00370941A2
MELIELRDMGPIDLAGSPRTRGSRLERTNALRIAPNKTPDLLARVRRLRLQGEQSDPRLTRKLGEGHHFQSCTHTQPAWCDLCGEFIWGIYKKSLRCTECRFTCHYRCRSQIRLDCSGSYYQDLTPSDANEQPIERDTNVDEKVEREQPVLSRSEIEQKIKEYNGQMKSNLFMSLSKDGSYTGFIRVQLKLIRPVSVPASKKPQSIHDAKKSASSRSQAVKRRTSFYLPKDTAKHLHISSRTKASEVIEALLKKFMVVDNPRKFALFERAEKEDQVYLRKLSDEEQPLQLRLLAGPNEKMLSFVLRENETGEVNWDAFSMPELKNFLRILQREEEEHVKQILQKYARCREKMQEQLTTRPPG